MLKDLTEHTVLRHDHRRAVFDLVDKRPVADLGTQSGPVVIIDMDDTLTLWVTDMASAVQSEMSALAVTADDIFLIIFDDTFEILHRALLPGDRLIAHHAILSPADERVVRTAKSDIVNVVIQMKLHRRELRSRVTAEDLLVLGDHQAAEAPRFAQGFQEAVVRGSIGTGASDRSSVLDVEVIVRQHTQHDVIYLAERFFIKAEIRVPADVFSQRAHTPPPVSASYVSRK